MLFRSTIQTGTLLRVGTQIIHHEVKETFETKAGNYTKYVGLYCAVYTCFGVFLLNLPAIYLVVVKKRTHWRNRKDKLEILQFFLSFYCIDKYESFPGK